MLAHDGYRLLHDDEKAVVRKLLAAAARNKCAPVDLDRVYARETIYGDVGRYVFASQNPENARRFAGWISEALFDDTDGGKVSLAMNVDQFGDLFEIDIWKLEGTPFVRLPDSNDLQIVRNIFT